MQGNSLGARSGDTVASLRSVMDAYSRSAAGLEGLADNVSVGYHNHYKDDEFEAYYSEEDNSDDEDQDLIALEVVDDIVASSYSNVEDDHGATYDAVARGTSGSKSPQPEQRQSLSSYASTSKAPLDPKIIEQQFLAASRSRAAAESDVAAANLTGQHIKLPGMKSFPRILPSEHFLLAAAAATGSFPLHPPPVAPLPEPPLVAGGSPPPGPAPQPPPRRLDHLRKSIKKKDAGVPIMVTPASHLAVPANHIVPINASVGVAAPKLVPAALISPPITPPLLANDSKVPAPFVSEPEAMEPPKSRSRPPSILKPNAPTMPITGRRDSGDQPLQSPIIPRGSVDQAMFQPSHRTLGDLPQRVPTSIPPSTVSVMSSQALRSGQLGKLSSSDATGLPFWKRRHVVLTRDTVYAFRSAEPGEKPVGKLALDETSQAYVCEHGIWVLEIRTQVTKDARPKEAHEGRQVVGAAGGAVIYRTWTLQCLSKEDMVDWLADMKKAITYCNSMTSGFTSSPLRNVAASSSGSSIRPKPTSTAAAIAAANAQQHYHTQTSIVSSSSASSGTTEPMSPLSAGEKRSSPSPPPHSAAVTLPRSPVEPAIALLDKLEQQQQHLQQPLQQQQPLQIRTSSGSGSSGGLGGGGLNTPGAPPSSVSASSGSTATTAISPAILSPASSTYGALPTKSLQPYTEMTFEIKNKYARKVGGSGEGFFGGIGSAFGR